MSNYGILKSIASLKVPFSRADKIKSLVRINDEELGARLGALEMEGYVKTKTKMELDGNCLPNGICAAGLTNQGNRALSGPRW